MDTGERSRIIALPGVRNLRDVGGYRTTDDHRQTRWQTLYRSDCTDELDETGQQCLLDAGLRTVIDLRDSSEVTERPSVFAASNSLRYLRMPFYDGPPPETFTPDLHRGYRRELDELGEQLVSLANTLVTPGTLPALIHCAAGKDRTGVAIGVLLATVGTRPDLIAEDYALSEKCLGPDNVRTAREWSSGAATTGQSGSTSHIHRPSACYTRSPISTNATLESSSTWWIMGWSAARWLIFESC
jgi:protein-tyrosine phosphatase